MNLSCWGAIGRPLEAEWVFQQGFNVVKLDDMTLFGRCISFGSRYDSAPGNAQWPERVQIAGWGDRRYGGGPQSPRVSNLHRARLAERSWSMCDIRVVRGVTSVGKRRRAAGV